jgi:hypothetical protein
MAIAAAVAVQLENHEPDAAAVAASPADSALVESDQLLVAALHAVASLRDTVDRVVVFTHLRQLLEHELCVLGQTVANEQTALDEVVWAGRARVNELRAREKYVAQTLRQVAPGSQVAPGISR